MEGGVLLSGQGKTALITSSLGARRHFAKGQMESLSGLEVKLTVAAPHNPHKKQQQQEQKNG